LTLMPPRTARLVFLEQVRVAGWCPKCLVSSLGALVFGIVVGGVPTGVVRSVPFCVDCGRLTQ